MLFTTILLALAAASPIFSAPVPSTELTRRYESGDTAVEPLHDTLVKRDFLPPSKRLFRLGGPRRDGDPRLGGLTPRQPGGLPTNV